MIDVRTPRQIEDERVGATVWAGTFPENKLPSSDELTRFGGKLAHIHARYSALQTTTDRARIARGLRDLEAIQRAAQLLAEFGESIESGSDELAPVLFRRREPAEMPVKLFRDIELFAKCSFQQRTAIECEDGNGGTNCPPISVQDRLIISLANAFEKAGLGDATIVNWNRATKRGENSFERFTKAFCKIFGEASPARNTIEKALAKRKLPDASLESVFLASLKREARRHR